jgi:hypothetical protein
VELGPSFNEPLLPPRQASGQSLDRVNAVNDDIVLVVRMEVGTVMLLARLRIHPDDDTEESRNLRHEPPTLRFALAIQRPIDCHAQVGP